MKNSLLILLIFFFCNATYGQYTRQEESSPEVQKEGGIEYAKSFKFKDGAYRTFNEFKHNAPSIQYKYREEIKKEGEISESRKDTNLVLYGIDENLPNKLMRKKVWGYSKDGNIYVFSDVAFGSKMFFELDIIGGMMLTSFQEEIGGGGATAYGDGRNSITIGEEVTKVKLRLVDAENGNVFMYNTTNFKSILKRDRKLFTEYSRIKGTKKQKDMMFIYLKKYNEKHPFYILNSTE